DTIQHFSKNMSELKKLAAPDYEDLLQADARHRKQAAESKGTSMAPPKTKGKAKAKANIKGKGKEKEVDTLLGSSAVENKIPSSDPHLESEAHPGLSENSSNSTASLMVMATDALSMNLEIPAEANNKARKCMQFSLNTYKTHAIGDYVQMIKDYGTTNLYSTETVSVISGSVCMG
ncbi:hypothetical protein DXG01_003738, partial [Tephrocybe rancida]